MLLCLALNLTKHKLPLMKDIPITIGGSTMSSSSHVRNLGVIFDSTLSMTNHISAICRTAYTHLQNISRIRRYLTPEATKSLVHAFIMSRLDYGNVLLAGRTSTRTLEKAPANTKHRCPDNHLHTTP